MFKKLLGKSEVSDQNSDKALLEYILKAGVTDLRSLLLGQIEKFSVDENLVVEVLKKMSFFDENSKKRFLESSDADTKLKKAFDAIITAANSKKISVEAVELIQKFIHIHTDLIEDFDKRNKQIYMHKLTKALETSIINVEQITTYMNKMSVINGATSH